MIYQDPSFLKISTYLHFDFLFVRTYTSISCYFYLRPFIFSVLCNNIFQLKSLSDLLSQKRSEASWCCRPLRYLMPSWKRSSRSGQPLTWYGSKQKIRAPGLLAISYKTTTSLLMWHHCARPVPPPWLKTWSCR